VIAPLVFKGRFNYDPEGGLLNISHLRFYQKDSIISLFKKARFSKIEFYNYLLSLKAKVVSFFILAFLKDFFVYKFMIIGQKKAVLS